MKKITYTITNITPKRSFISEEKLKEYCATHEAPSGENGFKITKTVVDEDTFALPCKVNTEEELDMSYVVNLLHVLADAYDAHVVKKTLNTDISAYRILPYYFSSGESNREGVVEKYIIDFLRSIKPEDIKEFGTTHTDYSPCNNFFIYISNKNHKAIENFIKKYNAKHPDDQMDNNVFPKNNHYIYGYSKLACSVRAKMKGIDPNDNDPNTIDFSKWTDEEIEYYNTCIIPNFAYIQFRAGAKDIEISHEQWIGHHVHKRNTYSAKFTQKRYEWCLECIKGNFKKFK